MKSVRILNPAGGSGFTSRRNAMKYVYRGVAVFETEDSIRFISADLDYRSHAARTGTQPKGEVNTTLLWQDQIRTREAEAKALRKERELSALGRHTELDWIELLAKFKNRCLRCGVTGEDRPLTRDHITPLAMGGSNFISNIQPLCLRCNSWKGARDIDFRLSALRQADVA